VKHDDDEEEEEEYPLNRDEEMEERVKKRSRKVRAGGDGGER